MSSSPRPIYLFADSQLLFWKKDEILFLNSIRELLGKDSPRAAYVGASNGDAPEFFEIFKAAMEGMGIHEYRGIVSSFHSDSRLFLEQADLVVLAGGDTARGWDVLQSSGMSELLLKKYHSGTILIGISAGAIQLGQLAFRSDAASESDLFPTLGVVPFVIDAHQETTDWANLRHVISAQNRFTKGIGIPAGGGLIYHPNLVVEPIRNPLSAFSAESGHLSRELLFPNDWSAFPRRK